MDPDLEQDHETSLIGRVALYALLLNLGLAVTFLFGRYAPAIGPRTGSPTLIAEGRHRHVDVLSSIVVLVSVLPGYFEWDQTFHGISIDQVATGVVLIFIARAGWQLLLDGMRVCCLTHPLILQPWIRSSCGKICPARGPAMYSGMQG